MTFQLTKFKARSTAFQNPTRKLGIQQVHLVFSGANTDAAVDLSDTGGTFWTAALADTTNGTLATQALAALTQIAANAVDLIGIRSETLINGFVQVLSLTSGLQYTQTIGVASATVNAHSPILTFNSGSAPTAYSLYLEWMLSDGIFPLSLNLG